MTAQPTPPGYDELRSRIPVLRSIAYLNAGTFGPLHENTVAAQQAAIATELAEGRSGKEIFEAMMRLRGGVKRKLAEVIGVPAANVALTTSTGQGCNIVFAGLGLGPGDEVVTTDAEHFGMLGPLGATGATVRIAKVAGKPAADAAALIAAEITSRTRLLALSHVIWSTGQVLPLAELRASTGIPILVDGAQSAGAIDVTASAPGLDFYTMSAQKWLCGPDQTGALYVKEPGALKVGLPSYMSAQRYEKDGTFIPHAGAARFEQAFGPGAALSALDAALDTHPAWRYMRALQMAVRCRELLVAAGHDLVTEPGQATLVTWVARGDSAAVVAKAATQGVVIRDLPGTGWVRASCGWWTSEDDLQRLVAALT